MQPCSYILKKWDADFFGFGVAEIRNCSDSAALKKTCDELRSSGIQLIYFISDPFDTKARDAADTMQAFDGGIKIAFLCNTAEIDLQELIGTSAESYRGELNNDLISLAIQSGAYSRFRLDKQIPTGKFEELYTLWMKRSLSGEIAKEVSVIKMHDEIAGMVTIDVKENSAEIGLLAVAEQFRNKKIGTRLVKAAQLWAKENNYASLKVFTQKNNKAACRLYSSCGFIIEKEEAIRHIWL